MKITNFDRPTIGLLRAELAAAIAPVAKARGLEIVLGTGTFTRRNLTLKVEIATKSDGGTIFSKDREAFRIYCGAHGLIPEDIDRKFESSGAMYTIVGLNPRAFKFPIIGERVATGTLYKFSSHQIKMGLV